MSGPVPVEVPLAEPAVRPNLIEVGAYLAALLLCELVSDIWQPVLGTWMHAVLAVLLLIRGARAPDRADGRFFLAIAVMPLVRIVSFAVSPSLAPGVWYFVVAEGLYCLGAISAARLLRMPRADLGLCRPRSLGFALLILFSGVLFGWMESRILHPAPLAAGFTLAQIWLPALLLIVSTGFVEEFAFRGLIQRVATEWLGTRPGIVFTAIGWSMLHIGWNSALDVVFVFGVGLAWGWMRERDGSILSTSLAHGIANVALFLVVPFLR